MPRRAHSSAAQPFSRKTPPPPPPPPAEAANDPNVIIKKKQRGGKVGGDVATTDDPKSPNYSRAVAQSRNRQQLVDRGNSNGREGRSVAQSRYRGRSQPVSASSSSLKAQSAERGAPMSSFLAQSPLTRAHESAPQLQTLSSTPRSGREATLKKKDTNAKEIAATKDLTSITSPRANIVDSTVCQPRGLRISSSSSLSSLSVVGISSREGRREGPKEATDSFVTRHPPSSSTVRVTNLVRSSSMRSGAELNVLKKSDAIDNTSTPHHSSMFSRPFHSPEPSFTSPSFEDSQQHKLHFQQPCASNAHLTNVGTLHNNNTSTNVIEGGLWGIMGQRQGAADDVLSKRSSSLKRGKLEGAILSARAANSFAGKENEDCEDEKLEMRSEELHDFGICGEIYSSDDDGDDNDAGDDGTVEQTTRRDSANYERPLTAEERAASRAARASVDQMLGGGSVYELSASTAPNFLSRRQVRTPTPPASSTGRRHSVFPSSPSVHPTTEGSPWGSVLVPEAAPQQEGLVRSLPQDYHPPHYCRFGGFPHGHETVRETLSRVRKVTEHEKLVIQFCRTKLPLFAFFQLVEVLIPLESGSNLSLELEAGEYTYAYHWAPRNDLLARGLQMFETMGYRNTLFAHAFDQLTHTTARGISESCFPRTAKAYREYTYTHATSQFLSKPSTVVPTATSYGTAQCVVHVGEGCNSLPPPPTVPEALALCATLLDMFSPDAPAPSVFDDREQLGATAGVVPIGTRRMYQRQRDVAEAEVCDTGMQISKVERVRVRRVHCVSSHSSFEVSPTHSDETFEGKGEGQSPSPFNSFDITPFLTSAEGHRWLSEQEYVISALLFSIAGAKGPTCGVDKESCNYGRGAVLSSASQDPRGPMRVSGYSSPSQREDCTFDSYLMREAGFNSRSGPALTAAVDALLLGTNTSSGTMDALTVEEKEELLYLLLTSHPVVYVALKAMREGDGAQASPSSALSIANFSSSEQAVGFLEAWSRQAAAMFITACGRHNHVMVCGASHPSQNLSSFSKVSEVRGKWNALFGVKCSREVAHWVIGGGGGSHANHSQQSPFISSATATNRLVLTSDVECGSVAPEAERFNPPPTMSDPRSGPATILFRATGDTTDVDCKKVWFRFALKGYSCGVTGRGSDGGGGSQVSDGAAHNLIKFRALNMAPHGRLYRSGMRPVCKFGGPLPAISDNDDPSRRLAQWHLVGDCSYVPVRGDEEAEITFSILVPPAGAGAQGTLAGTFGQLGSKARAAQPLIRRQCCKHDSNDSVPSSENGLGSMPNTGSRLCLQCRIKAWLLFGVNEGAGAVPAALQPTVHVSFIEPYSYGSLLSHIALWHSVVKRSPSNIRFEERVLCTSVDGRKLHLLIVTSLSEASSRQASVAEMQQASSGGPRRSASAGRFRKAGGTLLTGAPAIHIPQGPSGWSHAMDLQGYYPQGMSPPPLVGDFSSGKKVVLLSGRVHPSEVTGSYALHGIIQFLLSSDAKAAQLRENFIFFIVPMLNPDGVSRGHNRQDQFGDNLNRCYNNPSPETQPTVLALKNVFEFLQQHYRNDRFVMYLDFHSHASQLLGFAFGNCLSPQLQPWNVLFPRLIDIHSHGLFSTSGSKFARNHMASKDGTSRVIFGQTLLHSYTIELSHFAHLQWNSSQGMTGGGVFTVGAGADQSMDGLVSFTSPLPQPHEDWGLYTQSRYILDEAGAAHSAIEPFFVILKQSAEVGRACLTALLDYCAVGTPSASLSDIMSLSGSSSPTLTAVTSPMAITHQNNGVSSTVPRRNAAAATVLGRPSDALTRAGGMERLVREARQQALKTLQPQQGARVDGLAGKVRGSNTTRPSWNGF